MSKIKIAGVPPFDGEYELDQDHFNGADLHTIKQISGVRAGELAEALAAGDWDLMVAFTVIALRRAGRTVDPEEIMQADVTTITLVVDEAEAEMRPPPSPPASGPASSSGDGAAPPGHHEASGGSSSGAGDQLASRQSRTGNHGSETFAGSGQGTSAS